VDVATSGPSIVKMELVDDESQDPEVMIKVKELNMPKPKHQVKYHNVIPDVEIKDEPMEEKESEANPEIHPCPDCEKTFGKLAYMKKHQRRAHTEHGPQACDICGNLFHQAADLKSHVKRVHVNANMIEFAEKSFCINAT